MRMGSHAPLWIVKELTLNGVARPYQLWNRIFELSKKSVLVFRLKGRLKLRGVGA